MFEARNSLRWRCLFGLVPGMLAWGACLAEPLGFGDPTMPTGVVVGDDSEQARGERQDTPQSKPAWQLTSTLLSDQRRVAVINGRSVRPGEQIDGARLISVRSGEADIEKSGRRMTLRMAAPSVDTLDTKRPSGR